MKAPLRSLRAGFTLLELLTVMAIIMVLAGLLLAGVGYAQKKAAQQRAEAEIAALSVALESYKVDNGEYVRNEITDAVDLKPHDDSSNVTPVEAATLYLYKELSGDTDGNGKKAGTEKDNKSYFEFKPNMLKMTSATGGTVQTIKDPFGDSYGYSTAQNALQNAPQPVPPATAPDPKGYNPTFDLWSTGGDPSNKVKRLTNW